MLEHINGRRYWNFMELYVWGKSSGTLWNFIMGLMERNNYASQPEYIRQLISSQHSGSSVSPRSSASPLLQASRIRIGYGSRSFSSAAVHQPFGTSYQQQFLKRTVCLFFVVDLSHICLLLRLIPTSRLTVV